MLKILFLFRITKTSQDGQYHRTSVRPRHPDYTLPAKPNCLDRCPVRLFELFCACRPNTAILPDSPFYLQPVRSISKFNNENFNNLIWFTANGLGKNKIGSMLNMALKSIGMPIGRQINLSRFADAITAAAFSPAGGPLGERLKHLLLNFNDLKVSELMQQSLYDCTEKIVKLSTTKGSSIHIYLSETCSAGKLNQSRVSNENALQVNEKFYNLDAFKQYNCLNVPKTVDKSFVHVKTNLKLESYPSNPTQHIGNE